jgi:hypothetical protein
MTTIVLNSETANWSIAHLIRQLGKDAIELRDENGHVLAVVSSPTALEELAYADAKRDMDAHRDELKAALARKGGITSPELLKSAAAVEGRT